MVIEQKSKWLSWKGYTVKKRYSQDAWSEGYAFPARFFELIPYCIESYSQIRLMSSDDRIDLQRKYFERTDQSVMGNIYMGIMRSEEAARTRKQLELCTSTLMRFIQLLAKENLNGPGFQKLFNSLSPPIASYLRTCLISSCYFYTNDSGPYLFKKVLDQPLYLELGTDILANGTEMLFSEFQVRYATPYPHLLTNMCEAYAELLPELFQRFGLRIDRFEHERNRLLAKAIEKFTSLKSDKPTPVLLDAWAYLQNSGANWIKMARDFQMSYLLFDDMVKGRNFYESAYKNGRLAIFNQPPLNLLDPSHKAFSRISDEKLEVYDELEWSGFMERFLRGELFFANSPLSDIANDKAFYPALPELCKFFFDENLDLPVMQCKPCWNEDDHNKPNMEWITFAKGNKDKCVLAHRYLEGGMGIQVGRVMDQSSWDSYIETYVLERPHLFVIRDYFQMEIDFAHRILSAGYLPQVDNLNADCEITVADTLYSRFTANSPIMADNHRTILIFPSSADTPEPRYRMQT